ncbi:LUD domain-containing protein [Emticicia sp. 21SJ11W-3]|uniref:LutC/YkgG family protein n=1 Tax=Emticicia sp. 21SJ11W-3 TaxID=2916755 RepID=UPI00209ED5AA|nr:LUD domain-containing protein [Emticicia sp. 21SJ11W-3]UTA68024.1 LUD domain-containing protein [Emticicia sp. 21SJ11W-3]
MSSRDKILASVKANKPAFTDAPAIPAFEADGSIERFKTVLAGIGGLAIEASHKTDCQEIINTHYSDLKNVASRLVSSSVTIDAYTTKEVLERVDLAVIEGEVGVAENGAIWVPEANMINRALPFITQHLVLVLNKQNVVANMHEAYKKLGSIGNYGAFIAGPSKTADIEQALVIGAHGARSMMVILY